MPDERRVVIVGGGIGGLTAAIALRAVGIESTVYEQAPELREVGAGIGLWANALHVFRQLGLAPAVLRLGAGPLGGGIRSRRGRWLTRQPASVLERRWGEPTIAVLRAELQALLLDALPAGVVHLDARAIEIAQTTDGVAVRFENASTATGDVVVGADGLHSVVRAQLFDAHPPRYRGYTAWRGVARPGAVAGVDQSSEFWGRGERFGVLPARDGRVAWYASANEPAGSVDTAGAMATLLKRFGEWTAPIPAVLAATPEDTIVKNDVYDRPPTRRWVVGRAALLGDAAHPMAPDLAQGGCQAIVDAWALADSLAGSDDVANALRDYQRRRWRTAAVATLFARSLGQVGQWRHPVACWVRAGALSATPLRLQLRTLDAVMRGG
jgi:2-polyprenyl-6-methoxyphenol hydroxylase-like FAD-dependent oxidoreductase